MAPRKTLSATNKPTIKIGRRKYIVIQQARLELPHVSLLKRCGKVGQFQTLDTAEDGAQTLSEKGDWWDVLAKYSDLKDRLLGVCEDVTLVATTDEEFAALTDAELVAVIEARTDAL